MDKNLSELYQITMGLLMDKAAITNRNFFSQSEFEANKGTIYTIKSNFDNINEKLN